MLVTIGSRGAIRSITRLFSKRTSRRVTPILDVHREQSEEGGSSPAPPRSPELARGRPAMWDERDEDPESEDSDPNTVEPLPDIVRQRFSSK